MDSNTELDGEYEKIESPCHLLKFARNFAQPLERVWEAIATREGTKLWMERVEKLEPTVGAEFFIHTYGEDRPEGWTSGVVTEADAPNTLEYTWNQGPWVVGPAVQARVRYELVSEDSGTTLNLTHTLHEPGGSVYVPIFLSAWHFHLDTLAKGLAGEHSSYAEHVDQLLAESGLSRVEFFTRHVGSLVAQYANKFGLPALRAAE